MPRAPKLICRDVWKLYGADAAGLLAGTPAPDPKPRMREAGLIGAVRAANVRDSRGRDLCHHGPVGFGQIHAGAVPVAPGRANGRQDRIRGRGPAGHDATQQLIELRRKKMGMVFQQLRPAAASDGSAERGLSARGAGRGASHPRDARA